MAAFGGAQLAPAAVELSGEAELLELLEEQRRGVGAGMEAPVGDGDDAAAATEPAASAPAADAMDEGGEAEFQ